MRSDASTCQETGMVPMGARSDVDASEGGCLCRGALFGLRWLTSVLPAPGFSGPAGKPAGRISGGKPPHSKEYPYVKRRHREKAQMHAGRANKRQWAGAQRRCGAPHPDLGKPRPRSRPLRGAASRDSRVLLLRASGVGRHVGPYLGHHAHAGRELEGQHEIRIRKLQFDHE